MTEDKKKNVLISRLIWVADIVRLEDCSTIREAVKVLTTEERPTFQARTMIGITAPSCWIKLRGRRISWFQNAEAAQAFAEAVGIKLEFEGQRRK